MPSTPARRETWRTAVHTLRRSPGLGRLVAIRFAGQFGDGMFQAALGGAILFNPERETDPIAIAAGFAVLLLPYSIIGPFAGALLDRWDRRLVLMWASAVRGALVLLTALLLVGGLGEFPILLCALGAIGVSRFVGAGVSAALPKVVRQSWLVPTNSVLTTAGSVMAALGAATAVAVIAGAGAGDFSSGVAAACAAIGSLLASVAAARFTAGSLGPGRSTDHTPGAVRSVLAGLRIGASSVWGAPGVTTTMVGIATHRLCFGVNTLLMVLVLRDTGSESELPGGMAGFGVAVGATAIGMLIAALITPFVIPRLGRSRTVTSALACSILIQVAFVTPLTQGSLLAAAFCLGITGQSIKLSGDAAMQIDIRDDRRGQVFALQDTVFNIAFIGAIAAAATVVPPDGKSTSLALTGALVYALGLTAVWLNRRLRAG